VNRPRKSKGPYPPCFYQKHGAFYLVRANKWTRLGSDLSLALAEYGRLMEGAKVGGMPKAIDDYYAALPATLSKATKNQYRYAATVLKRKLAQFEPHEVKAKHVAGIKLSLADTPNMANRVLSFLRQVCADLVERQLIDTNPCVGVARMPEAKRKRLLSDAEWNEIHKHAGPRLRVIMELQYLTGQRISDVLKIRRNQIGEDGISFEQQKTGARLLVRWSPDLRRTVEAAKALSADMPPTLTLLRGKFGKAPDYRSVLVQWNEACAAAKVDDARLNDGRARSATTARRQGKDAQALLGHTNAGNTARYLRDRDTPEVDGPSFRQGLDVGQK
jgi:integrase